MGFRSKAKNRLMLRVAYSSGSTKAKKKGSDGRFQSKNYVTSLVGRCGGYLCKRDDGLGLTRSAVIQMIR